MVCARHRCLGLARRVGLIRTDSPAFLAQALAIFLIGLSWSRAQVTMGFCIYSCRFAEKASGRRASPSPCTAERGSPSLEGPIFLGFDMQRRR